MVSNLDLFLRKITFFATDNRLFPPFPRLFPTFSPPFFLPSSPHEAPFTWFLVRKNGFELSKYGVVNGYRRTAYSRFRAV